MSTVYHLTVTIHVLSAIVWLGGMFFFALVAPLLRDVRDDAVRARLFDVLGRRFRTVGWVCIGLLVITGIGQLHFRGWWGMDVWGSETFVRSATGRALTWKLTAVLVMLVVQGIHDFWLGPRAGKIEPGTAEARAERWKAAWLARLNAIVGVVLVYFAVGLVRGG